VHSSHRRLRAVAMGDPMRALDQRLRRIRKQQESNLIALPPINNFWGERATDPRCKLYTGTRNPETLRRREIGATHRSLHHQRSLGQLQVKRRQLPSLKPSASDSTLALIQMQPLLEIDDFTPPPRFPPPPREEPPVYGPDGVRIDKVRWFEHPASPADGSRRASHYF